MGKTNKTQREELRNKGRKG